MTVPLPYLTTANPYQGHRFSPVFAAPQYPFEDAQDAVHFGAPPQKPSLLQKVLKGALWAGGLVLGGLAFKRYCPGLAAQVGSFIPEVIHSPFKAIGNTWLGRTIMQGAESLLTRSEAIFNTLKGFLGGFFNKAS